jgi:hypothetical protein
MKDTLLFITHIYKKFVLCPCKKHQAGLLLACLMFSKNLIYDHTLCSLIHSYLGLYKTPANSFILAWS